MNNEEEIQIKISADTSDLEDSLDKVTKSVENNTKKMEKSFKNLHDDLKKVKDGFNFNTNGSKGIGALNTQLNKLTTTAKNVANKVKTTLQNAFNIQGKVKMTQQVDNQTTGSSASSGTSQVLGDVLTGSALGSKLQHGMAQMGKSIGDVIKKGIGDGVEGTDGVINGFFNTITKGLERMKSFFTNDIQGKLNVFTNASKQADLLNESITKTKNLMDAIGSGGISHGDSPLTKGLNKKVVDMFYASLKDATTEMAKLNKEYMKLGQDGNKNLEEMAKRLVVTRVQAKTLLQQYANGDIDTTYLEKKMQSLSKRAKYILGQVHNECINASNQVNAQITAMTGSVKGQVQMRLAKAFDVVIGKWKQLQSSVNGSKLVTTFRGVSNTVKTLGNNISKSLTGKALPSFKQIQAKCKEMTSNFLKVGKSAKKMGTDTKRATGMMKSGFMGLTSVLAPYLSIFAVFSGLKTSITSYVDSLETASKFKTVFGEMSDEAESWADSMSSSVAVSKQSLMDGSSNIMAIAKSMGMASDEAYDFATNLSEMAVDLNSFNNIEDGLDRIRSGVLGEYESLKSVGIVLSEDSVKAKMLAMGMNTASNESKMLARQMLIQEQMMKSGAMDNASREAQGLSAQLKMLRFNFQALGIAIGSAFGGILTLVVPVLNKIISACTVAFNKLATLINSVLGIFGVKVGGSSGGSTGSSLGDAITDSIGGVSDSLSGAGGDLADNMADSVDSAKKLVGMMGIDELNVLNGDTGAGSSGSGSSGGTGGTGGVGGAGGGIDISDAITFDDAKSEEIVGKASEFAQKIANALMFIGDNFKIGWDKASGYVQDAIQRLKDAFHTLGQAIEDSLVGFAENGGARLIQAVGEVTASLIGTATNIGASIVEIISGLIDHLNPQDNAITRFFIDSLSLVLEKTSSFAQSFSGWWDKIVDGGLGHFINACGDLVVLVGGLLCEALGTAIGWIEDFFNSFVGQAIIEGIAGTLDLLATALEKLCGWLLENKEVVYAFATGLGTVLVGAFVVANAHIIAIVGVITGLVTAIGLLWKNWDEIWEWIKTKISDAGKVIATTFDYMKTTAKNKFNEMLNTIKTIFNNVKDTITNVLSNVWKTFSDKFPNLANIVKTAFTNMKNIVDSYMNIIKTVIKTVIDVVKAIFTGDFGSIKDIVKNAFNTIKDNANSIWNSIKALIQTRLDAIKLVFSTIWNAISSTVKSVWNGISSYFGQIMNAIKNTINGVLNGIKTVFSGAWNVIKTGVSGTFNGIKNSINTIMNGIKTVISTVINAIKTVFSNGFNSAKTTISTIFNAIKTTISNVLNSAKSTISTVLNAIKTVFTNGFNGAKSSVSSILNAIKNTISSVLNSAKSTISTVINAIKTVFTNGFNGAKSSVSNILNGIKSSITNTLNGAKSSVSSIVTNISKSIKNGFNSAKSTVSSVFNSMKNSISSVMNSAKSTVSSAVSKIKGFFNFKWSLPKPKIPKFTAKWSTVFGVKIPTGFSISWHKDGGIFTQPTLLANGRHGVGEAGAEAVLPLSEFYKKEDERFRQLAKQLASNSNNGTTTVIVQLDGKEVARSTVKNMKQMSQLGQLDTSWL